MLRLRLGSGVELGRPSLVRSFSWTIGTQSPFVLSTVLVFLAELVHRLTLSIHSSRLPDARCVEGGQAVIMSAISKTKFLLHVVLNSACRLKPPRTRKASAYYVNSREPS